MKPLRYGSTEIIYCPWDSPVWKAMAVF